MPRRSLLPALLASTVAIAVAAGPLSASAYGDDNGGNGSNSGSGYSPWNTGLPPKSPIQDDTKDPKDPKDPKGPRNPDGPKGPQQGPGDELDGSYDGEVVTTLTD